MNIRLFSILRRINKKIKHIRRNRAGKIMSPVRRIEFVAPPLNRVCAMTFDDGPTSAPCIPDNGKGSGLTAYILDVMKQYGAKGTFDVIGSTAENYPDLKGRLHTHTVFGTKYDHYSSFERDDSAGALACRDLLNRIINEGHEIANHGYTHRIFGPSYIVYRQRKFMKNIDSVVDDLSRLHDLVRESVNYEIKLSRPPHYVDKIGRFGLLNSYDAYAKMGYHYMAASFDGGGWLPTCGDYKQDVENMVSPLRDILEKDPDSLSGAIIFQKDGYNMSMQSPVADALAEQLKILYSHGYVVTTVSELMDLSPFEDVTASDPCLEAVRYLERAGYTLGFRNNTFKPDYPITLEQLEAMCTKRENFKARRIKDKKPMSSSDIQKFIEEKFGNCSGVEGNLRRHAVIAIYERVSGRRLANI